MGWTRLLAVFLLVAACSPDSQPATTPFPPPSSTSSTSTSKTTTMETTTTLDRLSEIEAIYQDLEERRLDALYRHDEEAYRALFANDGYLEESLDVLDLAQINENWREIDVVVVEILHDSDGCIAVRTMTDYSNIAVGGGLSDAIEVIEKRDSEWGISYVGTGWICEGPHPFS